MKPSQQSSKIIVTGGAGFLGTHIVSLLVKDKHYTSSDIIIPRSKECDLTDKKQVNALFDAVKPEAVIHLATPSGGSSYYRDNPATIFSNNLNMGMNVLEACVRTGVKKVIIAGSALGYPANAPQPYKEADFWAGYPEEAEAAYGVSHKVLVSFGQSIQKQHGIQVVYVVLPNLYGPEDHFDKNAHVLPSWIMRFADAIKNNKNTVEAWGSGKALREFLYVEDAAKGIISVLQVDNVPALINLGSEEEISLHDLAEMLSETMNYSGKVVWDTTKPEGRLRRGLDSSLSHKLLNFKPKTSLKEGLKKTVNWYNSNFS